MSKSKKYGLIVALLLLASMAALGWMRHAKTHGPEAVLARAKIYWEALRLNDISTRYYLERAVVEGVMEPHLYPWRTDFGVKVAKYTFGEVRVVGDRAEIQVTKELTLPDFKGKTFTGGTVWDAWSYVNGDWYHMMEAPAAYQAPQPPEAAGGPPPVPPAGVGDGQGAGDPGIKPNDVISPPKGE